MPSFPKNIITFHSPLCIQVFKRKFHIDGAIPDELPSLLVDTVGEVEVFLNSKQKDVRGIAVTAYLFLEKVIWNLHEKHGDGSAPAIDNALDVLAASLRNVFTKIMTVKTNRTPISVIEDTLARLPDFCVHAVLPLVIQYSAKGRNEYLQCESLRILKDIWRRYSSVNEASKAVLLNHAVETLGMCQSRYTLSVDPSTPTPSEKSKLLKAVYACGKEILTALKAVELNAKLRQELASTLQAWADTMSLFLIHHSAESDQALKSLTQNIAAVRTHLVRNDGVHGLDPSDPPAPPPGGKTKRSDVVAVGSNVSNERVDTDQTSKQKKKKKKHADMNSENGKVLHVPEKGEQPMEIVLAHDGEKDGAAKLAQFANVADEVEEANAVKSMGELKLDSVGAVALESEGSMKEMKKKKKKKAKTQLVQNE